jgi:hypothetical protein
MVLERAGHGRDFQSHGGVNDRGRSKAPYTSILEHSNAPHCLSENKTPYSYSLWNHINISLR